MTTQGTGLCDVPHRHQPERPRRAVDGMLVCRGHLEALRTAVAELPALHNDLEDYLAAARTTAAAPVTGSHEPPLPFNEHIAELRSQIRHDLTWWTRDITDALGTTMPADRSPTALAGKLAPYLETVCRGLAGVDTAAFVTCMTELRAQAHAACDLPRRQTRIDIGPCLGSEPCDGRLLAVIRDGDDQRPSAILCNTCALTIPPEQWHHWSKRYLDLRTAA